MEGEQRETGNKRGSLDSPQREGESRHMVDMDIDLELQRGPPWKELMAPRKNTSQDGEVARCAELEEGDGGLHPNMEVAVE